MLVLLPHCCNDLFCLFALLGLASLVAVELAPLKTWMKYYCSSINRASIGLKVVGINLLPCEIDVG